MENTIHAIGRRKESVAKVWLKTGNGNVTVNDKEAKQYFDRDYNVFHMLQPMDVTSTRDKYDVVVRVSGGGKTGQAGAARLGIARALAKIDEGLKTTLSRGGFLKRDPRMVERKKYGRMKARRRYQFSKR
ncbi:MAG: 30S ribosomal protein S9 [Candidatus Goldbacteria bacterium]|nr:30S ribosomal protein S9 [Candidatus Goldiibacteriota bacterium]HPD18538.1 30S ribosomal protein S9 [Candidatus Goldiibacteriota bacterium]